MGAKKIVHLILTMPVSDIKIDGVKVTEKQSELEYTLEVNLDKSSIGTFIGNLTELCEFSDISIKELPMETIITQIYEGK